MSQNKNNKLRKYYFLVQSGTLGLYIDLYDEPNVCVYSSYEKLSAKPVEKNALKMIDRFGQWFQYSIFTSYPGIVRVDSNAVYIIDPGFLRRIGKSLLDKLGGTGAKLVLVIFDSMHASSSDLIYAKETIDSIKWNAIYTIDKDDAKEFGWNWIGLNYYSKPDIEINSTYYDCYFIGGLKGNREKAILDLFDYLKLKNAVPVFDLFCYSEKQRSEYDEKPGLNLSTTYLSYGEILKRTITANCIIEILQEGQSCQSLRYFEAIAFNKKLLTNNKHIMELPFYDPRYMQYFEKVEDIDVEWIKKQEHIDYQYNNEFSIRRLFDDIKNTV